MPRNLADFVKTDVPFEPNPPLPVAGGTRRPLKRAPMGNLPVPENPYAFYSENPLESVMNVSPELLQSIPAIVAMKSPADVIRMLGGTYENNELVLDPGEITRRLSRQFPVPVRFREGQTGTATQGTGPGEGGGTGGIDAARRFTDLGPGQGPVSGPINAPRNAALPPSLQRALRRRAASGQGRASEFGGFL